MLTKSVLGAGLLVLVALLMAWSQPAPAVAQATTVLKFAAIDKQVTPRIPPV